MSGVVLRHLPAADPVWTREADVAVVGAGAAGLSAALEAASRGRRVLLICKAGLGGGSTPLAQGGLAAVLDPADSADLHVRDTLTAGAGLCQQDAVELLVARAPREIARLRTLGARFDPGPLGLEGGHSRPRIVHAGGDASGAEVHRVLREAVLDSPVEVLYACVALDALVDETGRVTGLLVGSLPPSTAPGHAAAGPLRVGAISAGAVVLASGGYGQAFDTTTNPLGATGDGLALAARAGAEVADVEFVQFHPTVLWQAGARGRQPLVTEALRGAGAVVIDVHGRSVMAGQHPLADLAPRDVVAATMHRRMVSGDGPTTHLWLDATALGREELERHFPTVTAACRAAGIDPVTEPIPIAPGAHYACGGVRADMVGQTSLAGLYAVGEVAATGVHGANRLASNSLTEAVATGRRLGQLLGDEGPVEDRWSSARGSSEAPTPGPGVDPGVRDDLADAMSRHAGVLRHGEGLEHLLDLLAAAPPAGAALPPPGARDRVMPGAGQPAPVGQPAGDAGRLDLETVEATNLHTVSTLVALAALTRTESRGCHRRSDAPATRPEWAHRIGLRSLEGQVEILDGSSAEVPAGTRV